jgi:LisH
MNNMILEYFVSHGFEFTQSVFMPESGLVHSSSVLAVVLLNLLKVLSHDEIYKLLELKTPLVSNALTQSDSRL